jgi:cyclic pyranopterin phosphate synthase
MSKLSHVDDQGRASMVDVSEKSASERMATAEAVIVLSEEAFRLVMAGEIKKGDVLATARIAGIMAAKKTSELIPLCHPLALSHAGVEFAPLDDRFGFRIVASAKTTGQTGVEMEALTAAAVAALTVYDMVKAVDKSAVIENIRLLTKSGGKSGSFQASEKSQPKAARAAGPAKPVGPASAAGLAKATPRVLIHEAAAPRAVPATGEREALRQFMLARRLLVSQWAKSAEVPVNELYGYLRGRSRALSAASAERLAKAARASTDEMFGRKAAR